MEVIWSTLAKEDLKNFYEHSKSSKAKEYILNLIDYVNFLGQSPYLGKKLFIHNNLEYHILIFRNHKIIYTITDKINIVSVIHSSRDIKKILKVIKSL